MIEIKVNYPEMCECGRLYKDRRDNNGKMMCSTCYSGLSVKELAKLWNPNSIPKENPPEPIPEGS